MIINDTLLYLYLSIYIIKKGKISCSAVRPPLFDQWFTHPFLCIHFTFSYFSHFSFCPFLCLCLWLFRLDFYVWFNFCASVLFVVSDFFYYYLIQVSCFLVVHVPPLWWGFCFCHFISTLWLYLYFYSLYLSILSIYT